MEYMNWSAESHRLKGFVCDPPDEIELWLFVDADLAGDTVDTKSSTGGYFVLVGPGTWYPLHWIYMKQTATARSTTEAETSAVAQCFIQECYPMLDALELVQEESVVPN